jgi:hypothetical protein
MGKVLMKGNEAIGEEAIRAGCTNYFAYPITPQSEVAEYLSRRLPEVGGHNSFNFKHGTSSVQSYSQGPSWYATVFTSLTPFIFPFRVVALNLHIFFRSYLLKLGGIVPRIPV